MVYMIIMKVLKEYRKCSEAISQEGRLEGSLEMLQTTVDKRIGTSLSLT